MEKSKHERRSSVVTTYTGVAVQLHRTINLAFAVSVARQNNRTVTI